MFGIIVSFQIVFQFIIVISFVGFQKRAPSPVAALRSLFCLFFVSFTFTVIFALNALQVFNYFKFFIICNHFHCYLCFERFAEIKDKFDKFQDVLFRHLLQWHSCQTWRQNVLKSCLKISSRENTLKHSLLLYPSPVPHP